ncbi:MAG: TATA-box-binding protein [Candidatus Bathyarchaeia archaeon]
MKPVTDIKIQNVVATGSVDQRFDLNAIKRAFESAEYNPKRFPGLVFRLKSPKTATLIFSSGKMVCTGARSEKEATGAIKKVVKTLKKSKIIILGRPTVKVQNIVASGHLHGEIDVERVITRLRHVIYEPDMFPGLIYRMEEPKAVILIFTSGAFVCTGARSEEMVHEAVKKLRRQLEEKDLIRYTIKSL